MRTLFTKQIAPPPAGTDWSTVLSNEDTALLYSITAQLTTSVVVANRGLDLLVTDIGGNLLTVDGSSTPMTASVTWNWCWRSDAPRFGASASNITVVTSCPRLPLPPGARVAIRTTNIDVGDQWSNVVATYGVGHRLEDVERELLIREALGIA